MTEFDRSRDLAFIGGVSAAADGTPGLGINIPITGATPAWNSAFKQLAFEQHLDVRIAGHDYVYLSVAPGTSNEQLTTQLDRVGDLLSQANQVERDRLEAEAAALAPLEASAVEWWRQP